MSGGVDSAVAALLLKEAGYEVVGVTCQIWLKDICHVDSDRSCCSNQAIIDAERTAGLLGIKHYVFNYRDLFTKRVIEPFCDLYLEGKTPNPCMDCNRYIRTDDLLKKAQGMGFDYLATGHYVRREFNEATGEYLLKTGLDPKKDQSYFLYQMNQEELAHLLFPLGGYTKEQIREIARENGIPVAEKKDSQDICFVPDGDHGAFIETFSGKKGKPSEIYHVDGTYLGKGKPFYNYTIGQRKGLGIAYGKPVYVAAIHPEENRVILGDEADLYGRGLLADTPFYISERGIEDGAMVYVKIRYHSQMKKGTYFKEADGFRIEFDVPVKSLTLGQSAVLYGEDKETVLGGGRIYEIRG